MQPADLHVAMKVVRIGLTAVSGHLLHIVGMLLCAGLFAWVLADPDWIRLAAACGFAVLVYLPAVRMERAKADQPMRTGGEDE